MFTSILIFLDWYQVHVPNTNDKVSELNVPFKLCADELMVLCEVLQRNRALIFELIVCAV